MRGGKPQPLATNVVDVSEDGSDGASLAAGRFGSPGTGVEMLEHDLVHAVVDRVSFQHRLAKVEHGCVSAVGHRASLRNMSMALPLSWKYLYCSHSDDKRERFSSSPPATAPSMLAPSAACYGPPVGFTAFAKANRLSCVT